MFSKALATALLGFSFSMLAVSPSFAADKKAEEAAEMQAMMAKAKEAGTPGPEHQVLNTLVGDWNVESRHWMKPGDKPQITKGKSEMEWDLGGRFIKQEFEGDWGGEKFEGLGYLGYDKVRKEYVSVWLDSMSTGIGQASGGQYSPSAKTLTDSGDFSCPMTGGKMPFRSVWKIVDNDRLIFSMFMKDPQGKEFRSMELTYKRAK